MKKILAFALAALFVLVPAELVSAGGMYVRIVGDTQARVLSIVDGDALRVQPVGGGGQVALVRLAGINTVAIREAQDYMAGALLGRTVDLILSEDVTPNVRFSDRWAPVYLSLGDTVYNRALVQRGLAYVDPDYQGHWMFDTLLADSAWAYSSRLGIWADDGFRTQFFPRRRGAADEWFFGFMGERVNVNTASASQINIVLFNAHSELGAVIVNDRIQNGAFNNIEELRDVLTPGEFAAFRRRFKVSTNINEASAEELRQLIGVTAAMAYEIVAFREETPFTNLDHLIREQIFTEEILAANAPFIALVDREEITVGNRDRDLRVNVNTATVQQWLAVPEGMPPSFANALVREAGREPFENMRQVGEFFFRHGQEEIFDRIRPLLVIE